MVGIIVIILYNTTLTQWLWIGGLAAVPDITRGSYLFFLQAGSSRIPISNFFRNQPKYLAGVCHIDYLQRCSN
jgi:hypothetical protein